MCAGGKKPTARSIKQDFETFFESFKIRTAWRKDFFDTLNYIMKALEAAEKNPLNRCFFAWRKDTVQFDLFYFHGSFTNEKFYRFSDYLFKSPQMSERLGISSLSGILRFGRYPAYHGISEPHLALKSSKTVVETAAYYYAASLSIAAFAEV